MALELKIGQADGIKTGEPREFHRGSPVFQFYLANWGVDDTLHGHTPALAGGARELRFFEATGMLNL